MTGRHSSGLVVLARRTRLSSTEPIEKRNSTLDKKLEEFGQDLASQQTVTEKHDEVDEPENGIR